MSERYGKGYDNIDDAAAAALWMLGLEHPDVGKREYMAPLVRLEDGKYYRAPFATDEKRGGSSYAIYRNNMRKTYETDDGSQVVGLLHNHPYNRKGDRISNTNFSSTDLRTATDLSVPSYLLASREDGLHQALRMGADRQTTRLPDRVEIHSQGEEFLGEFPWEEFKQHLMRTILERAPNDPRGLMR